MNRSLLVVLILAWALWLGGMVVLVLFVTQIFGSLPRPIAIEAAPVLFRTFANYQLIVGMIACMVATLLTMKSGRSAHALFTLLLLLALADALILRSWTNRMEALRLAGQRSGAEFAMLHHRTSAAYTTAMALLTLGGVGWIVTSGRRDRTAVETAPA